MFQKLKKFILVSLAFHVVMSLTLVLAANLFQGEKEKPLKPIVVDLIKGTGENPSLSPFKKTEKLPQFKKSDMKVTGKDKTPATPTEKKNEPVKEVKKEEPKKETPKKEEPKKEKTAKVANKKTTDKKKTKTEPKKAPLTAEEKRRQETLKKMEKMASSGMKPEAAQIDKEGDGQSPEGTLKIGQNELNALLVGYFSKVKKEVQSQWISLPQQTDSLKAEIVVQINSQGEVQKRYVETSSGNIDFDQSALKAIDRASPFPPPPDEISNQILTRGFSILFDPKSVADPKKK